MREMKSHLDINDFTKDLNLSKMSADEVHFLTETETKRAHPFAPRWTTKFITNLVCTKEAKVIANAAGRDAMALATCLKNPLATSKAVCRVFLFRYESWVFSNSH